MIFFFASDFKKSAHGKKISPRLFLRLSFEIIRKV